MSYAPQAAGPGPYWGKFSTPGCTWNLPVLAKNNIQIDWKVIKDYQITIYSVDNNLHHTQSNTFRAIDKPSYLQAIQYNFVTHNNQLTISYWPNWETKCSNMQVRSGGSQCSQHGHKERKKWFFFSRLNEIEQNKEKDFSSNGFPFTYSFPLLSNLLILWCFLQFFPLFI